MLKKIKKHSYGIKESGNRIVHGDNIEVLGDLLPDYSQKIRCVYIDPPYNNGDVYNHYSDRSHEKWLSNISSTLQAIKPLLSQDGSLWISIDDKEMHYLKVAADEVFGRKNFVSTIVWQQRTTRENRNVFSNNHEYILVYAADPRRFKASRSLLPLTIDIKARYKNPDNDKRGPWQSVSANVQAGHAVDSQFYNIVSPTGVTHTPPQGRCWAYNEARMKKEIRQNNIWFGSNGMGVPRIKKFLSNGTNGLTPETLWMGQDVGTNKSAKKHIISLFPDKPVFDTPKPEQLIKRILEIATKQEDLVLDAYLGSGTTAAVAHKMNRQYIGIEKGDHIVDYVLYRMKQVVKGEVGGVSDELGWTGGGGFEFQRYMRQKD